MTMAGLLSDRPSWDFPGAFYFTSTVISTMGMVFKYSCSTIHCDSLKLGCRAVVKHLKFILNYVICSTNT